MLSTIHSEYFPKQYYIISFHSEEGRVYSKVRTDISMQRHLKSTLNSKFHYKDKRAKSRKRQTEKLSFGNGEC